MSRLIAALYGVVSYLVFFLTFLYLIGFVSGFVVPRHVDSGVSGALLPALLVNLLLIALFGVQHSVMARPAFKRRLTQLISPAIERSTFVLFASLALIVMFLFWRPIATPVWQVEGAGAAILWALFGLIAMVGSFLGARFAVRLSGAVQLTTLSVVMLVAGSLFLAGEVERELRQLDLRLHLEILLAKLERVIPI